MSLDKAIKHGKEHRKEYVGCEYIDPSCRPHGGCDWCKGNRLYQAKKRWEAMDWEEKCYICGDDYDTEYN